LQGLLYSDVSRLTRLTQLSRLRKF